MEKAEMTPQYLLEIARDTIEGVEYCFLITLNKSGQANARLVQHFKPEAELTIWIGTSSKSRKVREILYQCHTTLTFQDDRDYSYVTLLGSASVETDLNQRQRYWHDDSIAYFPAGPGGNDYVLIKFVPSRIELMNFTRGVTPEPFGLRPAALARAEESWVLEGRGDFRC
ncbi:pyridoxamine 5'-phosphate oxidase family protein [Chroococcidiopsis sp. CCMEE 29]|uniref:pyridoxamine 5'-phosphate oxidase family protein n=1 Tax=Chroococcidiopsis sp. CCMEE 29 TaxID=155894 RepID=UPI002020BAD0|nr:pyridoxamine 5'-phosphate oxidase family protein [Chroococcidiopsis sp. CCMEE 29]